MHLTGVQRDGSRPFIRFLSRLAFHTRFDRDHELSRDAFRGSLRLIMSIVIALGTVTFSQCKHRPARLLSTVLTTVPCWPGTVVPV